MRSFAKMDKQVSLRYKYNCIDYFFTLVIIIYMSITILQIIFQFFRIK